MVPRSVVTSREGLHVKQPSGKLGKASQLTRFPHVANPEYVIWWIPLSQTFHTVVTVVMLGPMSNRTAGCHSPNHMRKSEPVTACSRVPSIPSSHELGCFGPRVQQLQVDFVLLVFASQLIN